MPRGWSWEPQGKMEMCTAHSSWLFLGSGQRFWWVNVCFPYSWLSWDCSFEDITLEGCPAAGISMAPLGSWCSTARNIHHTSQGLSVQPCEGDKFLLISVQDKWAALWACECSCFWLKFVAQAEKDGSLGLVSLLFYSGFISGCNFLFYTGFISGCRSGCNSSSVTMF